MRRCNGRLGVAIALLALSSVTVAAHKAGPVPVSGKNYAELDRWPKLAGVWGMDGPSLRTASAGSFRPPLKPEYAAKARTNPQNSPLPKVLCTQNGMPNIMGDPELMEITFTKGMVMIVTESTARVMRRIAMDGRSKPDSYFPQLGGYGVGHWEGDTLMVETSDVDASVEIGGVAHGPDMRIVEYFRLSSPQVLHSETITYDPEVLSEPWKVERNYTLRPNDQLFEYVCEQNNREALDDTGLQHVDLTPPR